MYSLIYLFENAFNRNTVYCLHYYQSTPTFTIDFNLINDLLYHLNILSSLYTSYKIFTTLINRYHITATLIKT